MRKLQAPFSLRWGAVFGPKRPRLGLRCNRRRERKGIILSYFHSLVPWVFLSIFSLPPDLYLLRVASNPNHFLGKEGNPWLPSKTFLRLAGGLCLQGSLLVSSLHSYRNGAIQETWAFVWPVWKEILQGLSAFIGRHWFSTFDQRSLGLFSEPWSPLSSSGNLNQGEDPLPFSVSF